jgi:exportin-2 (importin alpha re-exporter)
MLQTLLHGRGIPQNEHLARALVAIFTFLGSATADVAVPALQSFVQIVGSCSSSGLANPDYAHDILECIAVIMKIVMPAKAGEVEATLLPFLGHIWEHRIEDFMPYCFQIVGLLLDLTPPEQVKPFYADLFKQMFATDLWRAPGNVPALLRLLRAYFVKHQTFSGLIAEGAQLIFERFQFTLGHRKLGHCAFNLLSAVFKYLPFELYRQYFQPALALSCSRLQAQKTLGLEKELAISLFLFICVHEDQSTLPAAFEQIQPGMFANFLLEVWLPAAKRVVLLQRRKICIFGLTKLMGYREIRENKELLAACCQSLSAIIRWRGSGLLAWAAAFLPMKLHGDEPQAGEEFEVPFSRLQSAELGAPGSHWDPLPEVQDATAGLAMVRAALAPLQPAILELGQAAQPLIDALQPPMPTQ